MKAACRACDRPKGRTRYLCPGCWAQLPKSTRDALWRRGYLAVQRAADMYDQISKGVPLGEIEVAP